jgi:hypothetical protein
VSCCAMPGGCDNPQCYLCRVVSHWPQPKPISEQPKRAAKDSAVDAGWFDVKLQQACRDE